MRSTLLLALCATLLLSAVSASAQQAAGDYMPLPMQLRRGPGGVDVTVAGVAGAHASAVPNFLGQVFPPELVMRHQADIGLSSNQRKAITEAMSASYARVVGAQWSIQAATEQLKSLLDGTQVDESAALAQIDRVMEAEQQLKRSHFALLIRVKNQLLPEQQVRLRELAPRPGTFFMAPAHRIERVPGDAEAFSAPVRP